MSEEQDKTAAQPDKGKQGKEVAVSDKRPEGDSSPDKPTEKGSKPKHSTTQHAHRKRKSSRHKSSGWGLIAIILLGLIAAAGWYGHSEFNKTQQTFSDIQQSQVRLNHQSREFEEKMLSRMRAMQEQQEEMTEYIQVIRDKNQHLRKDWLLMEAEYLVQLSNYRLLFERDINTAIAALESADVRLRETGDPGVLSVRKVIAEAVQALRQVPQADLAGLSLTLSAVNKNIEKMPLNTPDPKSKKHEQKSKVEEKTKHVEAWSELPAAIWSDLKGLVEIRDHEAPIQPLLSPEERFFLIENVRLQVEQARLAMLSGQAEVYQERLDTAISWIEEHFDNKSIITTSNLDTLKKARSESIAPVLPDISATHKALQNYRLGRAPVVSNPPAAKQKEKQPAVPPAPVKQTPKQQPAPATPEKPVPDNTDKPAESGAN